MTAISIRQLLESGVHFGHQTRRWNPKMRDYIFGERNGIYIIDLQKTLKLFREAIDFVGELAARGATILFVGTKPQAQEAIVEEALRCGMFYVNNRWLGGLLTNFTTVQKSIRRYTDLESMKANGFYDKLSKKEVARLERERKKLAKNLKGIRDMGKLPDALFIVDSNKENIAVREAQKLHIPIIAVVDTNCDPELVDYVIPGNDDALRAIRLFASTVADAVLAGREEFRAREAERAEAEAKVAREAAQAEKAARKVREAKLAAEAEAATIEAEAEAEGEAAPADEKAVAVEAGAESERNPQGEKPARTESRDDLAKTAPEGETAEQAVESESKTTEAEGAQPTDSQDPDSAQKAAVEEPKSETVADQPAAADTKGADSKAKKSATSAKKVAAPAKKKAVTTKKAASARKPATTKSKSKTATAKKSAAKKPLMVVEADEVQAD